MTQFALVKVCVDAGEDVFRHLKPCPDKGLIADASRSIFGESAQIYELTPNGCPFDDLYLSAQRGIADGLGVGSTELFSLLGRLRTSCVEIALWYGDSFLDLPVVSNWKDFNLALARDIELPAHETYLHYQPECNG
ncbi:hypothetical protein L3V18_06910 [Lysobacter sp. TLK-CK17T]|uniref:Haloacid dehalogenase-like hydrolase n=1 Tax=Marilutibacter chinensis TaxID=2912247 RepID=A0ABS9HRF9_9GAMM|nr:hypothetical protein [Lysobacter chinensis]